MLARDEALTEELIYWHHFKDLNSRSQSTEGGSDRNVVKNLICEICVRLNKRPSMAFFFFIKFLQKAIYTFSFILLPGDK